MTSLHETLSITQTQDHLYTCNIHDKFESLKSNLYTHINTCINSQIYTLSHIGIYASVYVILGKREGGFCFLELKTLLGSFKKMFFTLN